MVRKVSPKVPMKDRIAHVELWQSSGLSQMKYAREAGIHPGTFNNWISQVRNMAEGLPPNHVERREGWVSVDDIDIPIDKSRKAVVAMQKDLDAALAQIEALTVQRDELMGKLEDAEVKIKSLVNIIVLAGHQIGDH